MTAVPPQHWPNHRSVRVPPPGVRRDPLPVTKKLPVSLKTQMERDFKEELLRPKSADGTMIFRPADLPPVLIRMQRYGQTALTAAVLRPPQLDVECVTLCLSGIDVDEDTSAMDAARDFLLGADTREPVVNGIANLLEMVGKESRPLGAHIHLDERSYDSYAVRIVTGCLVQAFFDQFGTTTVEPA